MVIKLITLNNKITKGKNNRDTAALRKDFDVSLTFCHSPGHTLTSTHVRPHPGLLSISALDTECAVHVLRESSPLCTDTPSSPSVWKKIDGSDVEEETPHS